MEHNASVLATDRDGNTPLHLAVTGGNQQLASVLLEHGQGGNTSKARARMLCAENHFGQSPVALSCASIRAHAVFPPHIVQLHSTWQSSLTGNTLLHEACYNGCEDVSCPPPLLSSFLFPPGSCLSFSLASLTCPHPPSPSSPSFLPPPLPVIVVFVSTHLFYAADAHAIPPLTWRLLTPPLRRQITLLHPPPIFFPFAPVLLRT